MEERSSCLAWGPPCSLAWHKDGGTNHIISCSILLSNLKSYNLFCTFQKKMFSFLFCERMSTNEMNFLFIPDLKKF